MPRPVAGSSVPSRPRPDTTLAGVLVSVSVPVGSESDLVRLPERARLVETLGIDAVFVTDHPAPPKSWIDGGGHPTLDPFVTLAYVAASTTTLRLHTNLLVLPYRHPLIAAKAIASLDALSQGRTLLGVGVGYLRDEFAALDIDHAKRGRLMDDALTQLHQALTGEPFGDLGTVISPAPVQQLTPPIWIGGNSLAAMRRAVKHGDGWAPMPSPAAAAPILGTPGIESSADLGDRIARLRDLATQADRERPLDIAAIPRCLSGFVKGLPTADQALDEIVELRSVGVTAIVASLPDRGWDDSVEWLAQRVLNKI